MRKILLLAILFITTSSSLGCAASEGQFYVGANVGLVEYNRDAEGRSGNDLYLPRPETNEDELSLALYGGYSLYDWLAVELAYTRYGEIDLPSRPINPDFDFVVDQPVTKRTLDAEGLSATVLAKYQMNERIQPYARLGVSYVELEETVINDGFDLAQLPGLPAVDESSVLTISKDKTSDVSVTLGLGADLNITDHLAMRLDWIYVFDAGDYDLNNVMLGFNWGF